MAVVELWNPIEIIAETERWGALWKQMRAIVELRPFRNLFYFPLKGLEVSLRLSRGGNEAGVQVWPGLFHVALKMEHC